MSSSSTAPTILTKETVPLYLKSNAANLVGVFPDGAELSASAIFGGNVNYAFQVSNSVNSDSIFVKQAPEFVAVFGPDGFPLTSARMQQEIDVYTRWGSILGAEDTSRFLPKIHYFDALNMVFVMEFLEGYELLEHSIVNSGLISSLVASNLGEFMGRVHAATHSGLIEPSEVENLKTKFENRAMRDIQLEFVFSKCYAESPAAASLRDDAAFMAEILQLKSAYNGEGNGDFVLCHGDLHPGSVMVINNTAPSTSSTASAKVIDPEFTVYGPAGLDVGSLLSGFILGAVHHAHVPNKPKEDVHAAITSIRNAVETIFSNYSSAMLAGGVPSESLSQIEADTVGYAIAEVCRTSLGFAGGRKWLQFEDPIVKASADQCAMGIVKRTLVQRGRGLSVILNELDNLKQ